MNQVNYIVYDSQGKILRTGTCSEQALAIQAQEGEYVIKGLASDTHHKVVDNKVCEIAENEKAKTSLMLNHDDEPIVVTRKQWSDITARLTAIESGIK